MAFDIQDFNAGFYHFVLHVAKHGDDVKGSENGNTTALSHWMQHQHLRMKSKHSGFENVTPITDEEELVLDQVCFPWTNKDKLWDLKYQKLVIFHEIHGHCKVPRDDEIGDWVGYQQKSMKRNTMPEKRINQLQLLGFQWRLKDWDENYRQLVLFMETHGHCAVGRRQGSLGRWVSYQRESYKKRMDGEKSCITENQIKKLEDIGFVWSCDGTIVAVWHL